MDFALFRVLARPLGGADVFAGMMYFAHEELNGRELGSAPALMAMVAAGIVTVTIVLVRESIARLVARPVIFAVWCLCLFVGVAWLASGVIWTGTIPDTIGTVSLLAMIAAWATLFFGWITRPLFGLPFFPAFPFLAGHPAIQAT